MAALAKDSTLQAILKSMTGYIPTRVAEVKEIIFNEAQMESGKIDTTTGQNVGGSGFYRTIDYISLPSARWVAQMYAEKPWTVNIMYYDSQKVYKEYDINYCGHADIKNYPYCRICFFNMSDYLSLADFLATGLKIQYIEATPGANEYFLSNYLFNGDFHYDRNEDNIADGWTLQNSPTSYSVSNDTQIVTPSAANFFLRMDSDTRLLGHVMYVGFTALTQYDYCLLAWCGINVVCQQNSGYTRASALITGTTSNVSPRFSCGANAVAHPIYLKNVMMIDLTMVYGEGNEPTLEQVESIIDTYYGGYVPCQYNVKYDDSDLPTDILTRLAKIQTATDTITFENGAVSSVGEYVNGELSKTITITRDNFGNIVAIEEG